MSLNKTILCAIAIFTVGLLISVYVYTEGNRYSLGSSNTRVYKIDRRTGKTWALHAGGESYITPDTTYTTSQRPFTNLYESVKQQAISLRQEIPYVLIFVGIGVVIVIAFFYGYTFLQDSKPHLPQENDTVIISDEIRIVELAEQPTGKDLKHTIQKLGWDATAKKFHVTISGLKRLIEKYHIQI